MNPRRCLQKLPKSKRKDLPDAETLLRRALTETELVQDKVRQHQDRMTGAFGSRARFGDQICEASQIFAHLHLLRSTLAQLASTLEIEREL